MTAPKYAKHILSADELRERFDYNPEHGVFRYKIIPPGSRNKIGDIAGYVREGRYLVIKIFNNAFYAHRLVWLYMFGEWPSELIDHINGDKLDNRLSNLRPATMSQNKANAPKHAGNSSGFKGVTKAKNRWVAQLTYQSQHFYLGTYDTKEQAHAAYCAKAKELHGEFFQP